jgi:hypothetical protein
MVSLKGMEQGTLLIHCIRKYIGRLILRWLAECLKKFMEHPEVPFLIAKDDTPLLIKRSCRWISVTPDNLVILNEDTNKAILERVSSLFVEPGKSDDLHSLPDGFLKHCSNLGVLILSHCAFSFVSPPFH